MQADTTSEYKEDKAWQSSHKQQQHQEQWQDDSENDEYIVGVDTNDSKCKVFYSSYVVKHHLYGMACARLRLKRGFIHHYFHTT